MTSEPELSDAAPQVLVHTIDGFYIRLRRTPAADVMALIEGLDEGEGQLLSFDLDNGRSQVHIPRAAIARVDVDWELSRWQRLVSWTLTTLGHWR